jgi:hypothetical protein
MASDIDYSAVLADLEAKRAVLDNSIAGIRQMLNLGVEQNPPAPGAGVDRTDQPATRVQFDSFFRMTMPDAVVKYLEMSKRPQTVSEITKALQEGGLPTTAKNLMPLVGSRLSRMKSAGEVANVQGKWGLAAWYPAARTQATGKSTKRKSHTKKTKREGKPVTPNMEQKTPASKFTPEQLAQIKKLHEEGKRPGEIAKEVGLHHFAVMGVLKSQMAKAS